MSLKLSVILRSSNLPTFLCLVSDEAGNGTQDCIFSRACALYMTMLFYLFSPDPGWELFFPASFTHALPSVWIPPESGYSTEMFFSWMSCDFDPLILFLARETFLDHCQLKLHQLAYPGFPKCSILLIHGTRHTCNCSFNVPLLLLAIVPQRQGSSHYTYCCVA